MQLDYRSQGVTLCTYECKYMYDGLKLITLKILEVIDMREET